MVVHEDKVFSGFGAEIAAQIAGEMFRYLDAPVQRVGSTFTPVGFNPILERASCRMMKRYIKQPKSCWSSN